MVIQNSLKILKELSEIEANIKKIKKVNPNLDNENTEEMILKILSNFNVE